MLMVREGLKCLIFSNQYRFFFFYLEVKSGVNDFQDLNLILKVFRLTDFILNMFLTDLIYSQPTGPLSTSDMEFLTGLSERFSSSQLLVAFQEALTYILALPEEKASGSFKIFLIEFICW